MNLNVAELFMNLNFVVADDWMLLIQNPLFYLNEEFGVQNQKRKGKEKEEEKERKRKESDNEEKEKEKERKKKKSKEKGERTRMRGRGKKERKRKRKRRNEEKEVKILGLWVVVFSGLVWKLCWIWSWRGWRMEEKLVNKWYTMR